MVRTVCFGADVCLTDLVSRNVGLYPDHPRTYIELYGHHYSIQAKCRKALENIL